MNELFSLLDRLPEKTPQAQAAVQGLKELLVPKPGGKEA